MANNLTDKEIIGFLNNLEDKSQMVCRINIVEQKPYDPVLKTERIDVIVADMIDILNRQQAEKEVMQEYIDCLKTENHDYSHATEQLAEENRQLQAEIERLKDKYECIYQPKAMIKTEAVKEFTYRLYNAFSQMQREYRKVLDNSGAEAMLIAQKVLKYYEKEIVGEQG